MDDDAPTKSEPGYPLASAKMSKTPSWIMLGFLLGAGFVLALPPLRKKPPAEPTAFKTVEPPRSEEPRPPPELMTIEAVFAAFGKPAVWADDTTEIAFWNPRDKAFTDFYEVRRIGPNLYFRTIPQLTRRIISRGKPVPESPLQFTETEEQYQEWRQHGRSERPAERDLRPAPPPSRTDASIPKVDGVKALPPTFDTLPVLENPASATRK